MLDENQTPYNSEGDTGPRLYHWPDTACDGHFYLKARELGQPQTCPKCGVAITIGTNGARVNDNRPDLRPGAWIAHATRRWGNAIAHLKFSN